VFHDTVLLKFVLVLLVALVAMVEAVVKDVEADVDLVRRGGEKAVVEPPNDQQACSLSMDSSRSLVVATVRAENWQDLSGHASPFLEVLDPGSLPEWYSERLDSQATAFS
jgi:hypothetical protein